MKRFIEEADRRQITLLPASLEDYVAEDNPVRVVEAFVDQLDLGALGFEGTVPAVTGRSSYHPAVLLKIYIYGYLNRVQSSRRLERETQRNVELMWLSGRLAPDFKTIAEFRRDNGKAIRQVCRQFIELCRRLDLFSQSIVAIDGSKFRAVNNRDRNFTSAKPSRKLTARSWPRFPRRAATTCRWTTPIWPTCATTRCAQRRRPAATIRTSCRIATPSLSTASRRRSPPA